MARKEKKQIVEGHLLDLEVNSAERAEKRNLLAPSDHDVELHSREIKTLKDAVKPKNKRKIHLSVSDTS